MCRHWQLGSKPARSYALGLLLLCALGACASLALREPDIELAGIKPLNLSLSGQRLAITLNVTNPNSFDLKVREIDVLASLDGTPIATGVSADSAVIPAGGERTIELIVTAALDLALSRLRTLLSDGGGGLDYSVSGTLRLLDWPRPIPFSSDGRLDNPLATETR